MISPGYVKGATVSGLYALLSFGVASVVAIVIPDSWLTPLVAAWILSLIIVTQMARAKYLP